MDPKQGSVDGVRNTVVPEGQLVPGAAQNVVVERNEVVAPSPQPDAARLASERAFHDEAFVDHVRASTDRFYVTTRACLDYFSARVHACGRGKQVLEYGCGPGTIAYPLARNGAQVTGIDISDVAIRLANETAAREGLAGRAHFQVMNAEALTFPDASFDLVCGTGILHHLDLGKAIPEVARVVRPEGRAVFLEPLGHNPFINIYRHYTPNLRTVDEHPLLERDFQFARLSFERVEVRYFHLQSLLATPLRNTALFKPALWLLNGADSLLFRVAPFVRKYAWMAVIEMSQPRVNR